MRERIQVEERKSLAHLKVFVQRCLDIIEFLYFIEQEMETARRKFQDLMAELGPEMKDRLSKHKFSDFALCDSSPLIHAILQKAIYLQLTEDGQLSQQTLHQKQQLVSQLCPTLFSRVESTIFLGHSLLQTSTFETDLNRKDEIVSRAMANLLVDPERIVMDDIVPILAQNKQFQQFVHICLEKIKHCHSKVAGQQNKIDEIRDLLELILQVIEAVDLAVVAPRDSKASIAIRDYSYLPLFAKAIEDLNLEQRLSLRNNLTTQLANCRDVPEAINHVLQVFLFKKKDVDFICQKISPEAIQRQCSIFVNEQARSNCLTVEQFKNVYRILSKTRQPIQLARLVRDVLLQQVTLMEENKDAQLQQQVHEMRDDGGQRAEP